MPSPQYSFTGLILLSAETKPGIEESLLAVLEPFTVAILETQRISLRGRLIVGILIGLDPAHAQAVADDIYAFSQSSGLDVAIDFSTSEGQ
jgi:phosphoserine phosphatase